MIRLSVTDLDQYLTWLNPPEYMADECEGPEWLINRLTVFEPSPAMQAGSAFHAALELLSNSCSLLVHDAYKFKLECEAELTLPSQRELKIEREVLPGIVLVGKIDGLDGNVIRDYKLTTKLDAERYFDSMQWRAYLMLFETNAFDYCIFEGSPDREREFDYTIRAYHSLRFYRYPSMDNDVKDCASGLAKFIHDHKIVTKIQ